MVEYDSKLIYTFADRLYRKANQLIIAYSVVGLLIGWLAGSLFNNAVAGRNGPSALVLAIVLAVVGYALGSEKAFQFKLQAQVALCQVRIEENTRRGPS